MQALFLQSAGPLVCALAREKATSCNMHHNVLAQVDATDAGNNQKLSDKKADVTSAKQKLQRNVGRFQAIKYFIDTKKETLTGWRYYSTMGRWIRMARTLTI